MADSEIDIFKPVSEALERAIGSAFGAIRAFLADSIGQLLVAIYTPFYCILDAVIALFQVLFGLVEILFGWMPMHLFLGFGLALALIILAHVLRSLIDTIRMIK